MCFFRDDSVRSGLFNVAVVCTYLHFAIWLSLSRMETLMKTEHSPKKDKHKFNSLWPNDNKWAHKSGSPLAQVMACCLTAPNHYLNQCWQLINEVSWHSHGRNFTASIRPYILSLGIIRLELPPYPRGKKFIFLGPKITLWNIGKHDDMNVPYVGYNEKKRELSVYIFRKSLYKKTQIIKVLFVKTYFTRYVSPNA